MFTRNKKDRTKHAERDVPNKFNTFAPNIEVGPMLVVLAAN